MSILVSRAAALALTGLLVWGCSNDDDDAAPGAGGAGGSAGSAPLTGGRGGTAGKSGAGGRGGDAGQGGAITPEGGAGQGGTAEGGTAGSTGCPADILAADGKACTEEGKICSTGADNPCEFGQLIRCFGGVWIHQETFPDPNCGGAGAGGASGAGS